jgi:hypothetical protein
VSHNPGLQPLLPYLVHFISDEVVEQIKSSSRCLPSPYFKPILVLNTFSRLAVALRLVAALIASPHLHIEPFAHQVHPYTAAPRLSRATPCARPRLRQIMPAVITCIVCKALGGQRSDVQPFAQVHDHWCASIAIQTANLFVSRASRCACRYIRESAVVLVVRILKRYGAAYPTLIPRTMRTLLHALLDPSKVPPRRFKPCACASTFVAALPLSACNSVPAAFLHALWCPERHLHHVAALNSHAAAAPHAAVSPRPSPLAPRRCAPKQPQRAAAAGAPASFLPAPAPCPCSPPPLIVPRSYLKHLSHTIPIDPAVACAAAPSSQVPKLKSVVKLSRVQQVPAASWFENKADFPLTLLNCDRKRRSCTAPYSKP